MGKTQRNYRGKNEKLQGKKEITGKKEIMERRNYIRNRGIGGKNGEIMVKNMEKL